MPARSPGFCALALAGLVLGALALALGGCGDDPEPGAGGRDPDWSDPAADAAHGSPDGDEADEVDGVISAATLLSRLRSRVVEGSGHADPSFERDLGDVASVLWPPDAGSGALDAARVHMQVCNIAGEVGRWLAESEGARAERTKTHPTDVGLYDAFVEAATRGPDAYRTWCGSEGARLLKEHADARYRKHFPPR